MKYSELKRWLRKEGCYCDHEGGNHKTGIRPKQETSSPLEGTIQRKCAQTPLRQFGGKRGYNSPLPLFKEKRSNVGGLLDGLKQ